MNMSAGNSHGNTDLTEDKNLIYIEQLRIAAIFSVVLLHSIAPYFADIGIFGTKTWWGVNILNAVTRWGVPVFFMISGTLLLDSKKEESIKMFLKKRASKILIPFILWNIVYYIVNGIAQYPSEMSVLDFTKKFLAMDISYHFWFVYTLFGIYLFVPLLRKMVKAATERELWYLFCLIIFTSTVRPFLNKFFGIWIAFEIQMFFGYFGYFLLGYLINRIALNRIQKSIIYILGLLSALASIFGTYMLSSPSGIDAFFNGGYQFNSYLIAAAVFIAFKDCSKLISGRLDNISIVMGKLAFGVYLIHVLVLEKLQTMLAFDKAYLQILFCALSTFVISYLLAYAISKLSQLIRSASGPKPGSFDNK